MTTHQNRYLFSDYYLNEILSEHEDWKGVDVKKPFEDLAELYKGVKDLLPGSSEAQTEERFIRPALKLLGHLFEVQPPVETAFGTRTPDYALFPDEEAKKKAHKCRGKKEYFKGVLGVGDAKYWDRPLDKKLSAQGDPFENNNPNFQIDTYLRSTETRWGILTNGRLWRLYNRNTSYRLDTYYQVDLIQLLEQRNLEAFKYFYLLFRKEAFLPLYEGKTFLDHIYEGSLDYAKRVGAGLKENVYESLRLLATGFLKMEKNGLGQKDLEDIRSNSLVLLYRLLFMLYAEARNLLPLDNPSYRNNYSLDSLRKEIRDKLDKGETLVPEAALYHSRLKGLFELINSGSEKMGVPAYNGGLFKPENHPFLEDYAVGDNFAVQVIDKLSRSEEKDRGKVFVDYRSLDVRDLGSIYEGLLEYKLRLAEEDLVVTKKNNYIPLREAQGSPSQEIIRKGELYLATDKGERKATGSYYTPEYIVNYIVENTLGPIVEKAEADIRQKCKELEGKIKASRGSNREAYQKELGDVQTSLDDEVLKLKVLDPAMGSGHFLVRATEFLAEHIATNPYAHDAHTPEGESAIDYWKRRVVEHCIYGVDDNPLAVELAKLSLWLKTVARGKPLSFLDHHLRCGNSLIGAWVKDLATLPEVRFKGSKIKGSKKASGVEQIEFDFPTFTQDMALAVGDMLNIEQRPTDTIKDVEEKARILHYLDETRRKKYRQIANLWTSTCFENELSPPEYQDAINRLKGKSTVMTPEKDLQSIIAKAQSIAREKHLFHWELEFPEVFFDQHGRKLENPGFDVVMGNPPYVRIHELPSSERNYYNGKFECAYKQYDIYILFFEKGIGLLRAEGDFGFIASSKFLTSDYGENLRRHILKHCSIKNIVDVSTAGVFGEAAIYPYIFILKGEKEEGKRSKTIITFMRCNSEVQLLEKRTKVSLIPQEILHQRSGEVFSLQPIEVLEIFRTCERNSLMLGGVCKITRGFRPPPEDLLRGKGDGLQKLLYGDEMAERYAIVWRGTRLEYIPE
ncbi:MAG: N-6 DNA methylase, partial [Candidatus Brocadiaceae bacterium]|nr:N-6 DNA methylase [Candidatus Brocadiaceae bacterium]